MQIDFHHAVTYVLARWAGFNHKQADIIAYSAQYVDDAVNVGWISFSSGEMYYRTASSHVVWDVANNLDKREDSHSWIPFHFLPGNGHGEYANPDMLPYEDKLVCKQNSPIANALFADCVNQAGTPYGGLHRLGITAHVYADTWAHHDFSGIVDKNNDPQWVNHEGGHNLPHIPGSLLPNLGHADVLQRPDLPFLTWNYKKHNGLPQKRVNPELFVDAADNILVWMRRYLAADAKAQLPGLNQAQKDYLQALFTGLTDMDGNARHRSWLYALENGVGHGFEQVSLTYAPNGPSSWKSAATGLTDKRDENGDCGDFNQSFLRSDWKLFHDALQHHRFYVLNVLLPGFGICAG